MHISLRDATLNDRDFLWSLHQDTMREYVEKTWGWNDSWQRRRFSERFDPAGRQIIEVDGAAIGMLQVDRQSDFIFLKNIQISPSRQRRGIGTRIVRSLIDEAEALGVPLRLKALKVNPAQRFYERLDFRVTGISGTQVHMERPPGRGPAQTSS